jgi:alpha-1,6-mannosyltransferase
MLLLKKDRIGSIGSIVHYSTIILIGIASGLLYLLVHHIKGDIYLNGLSSNNVDISLQGVPANSLSLLWELIVYYSSIVALFALYFYLLRICYHGRLLDRRSSKLIFIFPVIFNLVLLFVRPYFSIDIFSYMTYGYFGITPGSNPYVNAAKEAANTPFGHQLLSWGWNPVHGFSPYGPLWTQLSMAVVRLTQNISIDILLLKSLVVAAHLISAALIWQILAEVRPKVQLLGTIVYLWNPMVTIEFAAEGHNDALMIMFTLFALLLTVNSRPATSILAIVFGILVKYIPIIFLPAQLVYYWRNSKVTGTMSRTWVQILLGLILGIGVAVFLYWQLWMGVDTFQGVTQQANIYGASVTSILSQFLKLLPLGLPANNLAALIIKVIFCIVVFLATLKVNSNKSLLKSCGSIALIYTLIVPTIYWPWYASFPIALMALSPYGTFQLMSFVLTLGSCAIAPLSIINTNGLMTWHVLVLMTSLVVLLQLSIFIFATFRHYADRRKYIG